MDFNGLKEVKLVNLKYVTLLSFSITPKSHVKVMRLSKRITN